MNIKVSSLHSLVFKTQIKKILFIWERQSEREHKLEGRVRGKGEEDSLLCKEPDAGAPSQDPGIMT